MKFNIILIALLFASCNSETQVGLQDQIMKQSQDSIIAEHLKNGAWKHSYYSREWQEEIDEGLLKDSTIAYLWQQKAMPLFKQGKYELGMDYIDKAVEYDPQNYLSYRAFIKCIFAKRYKEAIIDFEECRARFGYSYVQDHSYEFYIALSNIQLNRFEEARGILEKDISMLKEKEGADIVHHLDIFYLGICHYELGKYEEAIETFDWALNLYPQFSDVQYYKAKCLLKLGKEEEARELFQSGKENGKLGYTINEDNAIYERYPYQVRWHNK